MAKIASMALDAPMACPIKDLLAETGGSESPKTVFSALYSTSSPTLVEVAWALTTSISCDEMPDLSMHSAIQRVTVGKWGATKWQASEVMLQPEISTL